MFSTLGTQLFLLPQRLLFRKDCSNNKKRDKQNVTQHVARGCKHMYVMVVDLGLCVFYRNMCTVYVVLKPLAWTYLFTFLQRCHFRVRSCTIRTLYIYGFGGLGVACWPLVPKFAGSNSAEAVGFLGRKNPQHAFLRRGSKAFGPMS